MDRRCWASGKISYLKKEAEQAVGALRAKAVCGARYRRKGITAYWCESCHSWHITGNKYLRKVNQIN